MHAPVLCLVGANCESRNEDFRVLAFSTQRRAQYLRHFSRGCFSASYGKDLDRVFDRIFMSDFDVKCRGYRLGELPFEGIGDDVRGGC